MLALQTARCDPRAGWSHPEREEAETGSRVGRGGGGSWAGDQSRIVSRSPVADKQLSGQPGQKEGLPRGESPLGPPGPLLPVSPARLPRPHLASWLLILGGGGGMGGDLAPLHPVRHRTSPTLRASVFLSLKPGLYCLPWRLGLRLEIIGGSSKHFVMVCFGGCGC